MNVKVSKVSTGSIGKIHFSRLVEGQDLIEAIEKESKDSDIRAGIFLLIGSLSTVVLGYYKEGEYSTTRLDGPLEIVSCMGNVALNERDETAIHAHIIVSNEQCTTFGGHLMKDSRVGVTAELTLIEAEGVELKRLFDEKTKLRLLKL